MLIKYHCTTLLYHKKLYIEERAVYFLQDRSDTGAIPTTRMVPSSTLHWAPRTNGRVFARLFLV